MLYTENVFISKTNKQKNKLEKSNPHVNKEQLKCKQIPVL